MIKLKKALIIGSGPAGISASLYLARNNNIEVTVVSHGESALLKADKIENYFGFAEPISGKELLENGIAGAKRLGVKFEKSEVLNLQFTNDLKFEALTTLGSNIYDTVMIATGAKRSKPKFKGITEFEGRGVSYCAVCDAFFYRNKATAVIGSGEYALHEASALTNTSSSVTILTDGEQLKPDLPEGINQINKKIRELVGSDKIEAVIFEDGSRLDISGVFIAVGTAGSSDIARKIGAAVDGSRISVDNGMATTIPGLYAGGDCIGGLLQVSKSVYDGAAAAMSMIKFLKSSK